MTQYEYRTEVVPMQAGTPKKAENGQFASGLTTHFLNEVGRQGWHVVGIFPWMTQQGSRLDVVNGPHQMPVLFVVLERGIER